MNRGLQRLPSTVGSDRKASDPSQSSFFVNLWGDEETANIRCSLSLNTIECTTFAHYMLVNPFDH